MSDLYFHTLVCEEISFTETVPFKIKTFKQCNVKPQVSICCCKLFTIVLIYFYHHHTLSLSPRTQYAILAFGGKLECGAPCLKIIKNPRLYNSRALNQVQGPSVGVGGGSWRPAEGNEAVPAVTTHKLFLGPALQKLLSFPLGD